MTITSHSRARSPRLILSLSLSFEQRQAWAVILLLARYSSVLCSHFLRDENLIPYVYICRCASIMPETIKGLVSCRSAGGEPSPPERERAFSRFLFVLFYFFVTKALCRQREREKDEGRTRRESLCLRCMRRATQEKTQKG